MQKITSLAALSGKAKYFMSDRDHSRYMLELAEKDLAALKGMLDVNVFADEIFGFHAQQAVEKSFKSWISYLEEEYPLIHDLSVLLSKLANHDCDVSDLWDLVELNAFAVQFRYESFESTEEPLDRQDLIKKVQHLFDKVKAIIET